MMLTSRERVLTALNHAEPDRVPVFFSTSGATTMLAPGYEKLKTHLGITRPTRVFWRGLQYVEMDEEVLLWSGSDDGGYVLASVHRIQPDVPAENVVAMLDKARVAGRYPLAL